MLLVAQARILVDFRLQPLVRRRAAILVVAYHGALESFVFHFERELHVHLLLLEECERALGRKQRRWRRHQLA